MKLAGFFDEALWLVRFILLQIIYACASRIFFPRIFSISSARKINWHYQPKWAKAHLRTNKLSRRKSTECCYYTEMPRNKQCLDSSEVEILLAKIQHDSNLETSAANFIEQKQTISLGQRWQWYMNLGWLSCRNKYDKYPPKKSSSPKNHRSDLTPKDQMSSFGWAVEVY